jgi:hypothetical protein
MTPADFEVIRRICLISEAALDMDELIHGDGIARVLVVGKSIVRNGRKYPAVAAIVEHSGLLGKLEAEGRNRHRAVTAVPNEGAGAAEHRIPRDTYYPGPKA